MKSCISQVCPSPAAACTLGFPRVSSAGDHALSDEPTTTKVTFAFDRLPFHDVSNQRRQEAGLNTNADQSQKFVRPQPKLLHPGKHQASSTRSVSCLFNSHQNNKCHSGLPLNNTYSVLLLSLLWCCCRCCLDA